MFIPTWISTSEPSAVVMPTACIELGSVEIVPSTGALITPSLGMIAQPLPSVSEAKASSLTSLREITLPETGATSSMLFAPSAFVLGASFAFGALSL